MRDYFQVLGVPRDAGAALVRQACRGLSRRFHPDISGDCASHDAGRGGADHALIARDFGSADPPGDEIAIDFPCVAPLVDRMRKAFFAGDRLARWTACIELTRGEARSGARVPIDVPHDGTCGACGGRGEIWAAGCQACGGLGSTRAAHRVRLIVPPGIADGACLQYHVRLPAGAVARLDVSVAIAVARA